MNDYILDIFLVVLALINTLASSYIIYAPGYGKSQKISQVILIWLLPVFGAAFFSAFLWFDRLEYRYVRDEDANRKAISNTETVEQAISSDAHDTD